MYIRICKRGLALLIFNKQSYINLFHFRPFIISSHTNFEKYRDRYTTLPAHQTYFDKTEKNKETFLEAIRMYKERERKLRGHVEFIYAALKHLEEFGVHKELEIYKELLNIMPKGLMVARNIWQIEFMHYPKHQECAVQVLEQMTNYGVMTDSEVQEILSNTFGMWSRPSKKNMRMLYWMPKFKYASPWPLPEKLPNDVLELSKLAISQITSVDPATKVTVLRTDEVEDAIDDTWIVSAISPRQKELLDRLPKNSSLKLEGPFAVYLRDTQVGYFILRGDSNPPSPKPSREDIDDVSNISSPLLNIEPKCTDIIKERTVHEQDDGVIMAVCATGTSSRDSLLSWIRLLEKSMPALKGIPVLFMQSSPIGDVIVHSDDLTTDKTGKS